MCMLPLSLQNALFSPPSSLLPAHTSHLSFSQPPFPFILWVVVLKLHQNNDLPPLRSLVPTPGMAIGGASPRGASAPNVLPLL